MPAQSPDDDFQAQLEGRIVAYWGQEDELRSRLAEVKRELEDVRMRREMAEGLYRTEFGEVLSKATYSSLSEEAGTYTGLTWPAAIRRVLQAAGEPLHVKSIWSRLQEGGFWTGAQDPLRSIVAVVIRDSEIERVSPNTYTLKGGGNVR